MLKSFFALFIIAAACTVFFTGCPVAPGLSTTYVPKLAIDTSGPKYLKNVSLISYVDRISNARRATSFAWMDSAGKSHQLNAENYYHVVVLNFFGTWSEPAKEQLTELKQAEHDLKDSALFLGISQKESVTGGKAVDSLQRFANQESIDYQLLVGNDDIAYSYAGIDVVPTTFIIAPQGRIVATLEGFQNHPIIEKWVRKAYRQQEK